MNNEWLNNLRSRMEDHEEDIPEGLWDDIRDELFAEEKNNAPIVGLFNENQDDMDSELPPAKSVKGNRALFYRIGGMAAAIALLIWIIQLLPDNNTTKVLSQNQRDIRKKKEKNSGWEMQKMQSDLNEKEYIISNFNSSVAENALSIKEAQKVENYQSFRQNKTEINDNLQQIGKIPDGTTEVFSNENARSMKTVPENEKMADNENDKESQVDESPFKEQLSKELYAENISKKVSEPAQKKSWMLSMLTGSASSNSAEQQFPGYASIDGKAMNIEKVLSATEYIDDPLTQILLANQDRAVEATIRHKVPVTMGLSLYYSLGKKWGIGTGLNYTKLASELHSGGDTNYIKADQFIHYIGIPVQINYNVFQKGRFTGYVTGGALLEKPVAGNITTKYIVNNEIKETYKEDLESKPLQFSVNTAIGLQLKLVDRFGIYAEPGIGYHFNADHSPNTIYREKPFYFNVRFGVRLLLD
ncbi:outer membrane beta-barrel protein [Chryseobacterium sp. Mn2064]|uniref:outer membrane beta-barrel protein n=1 Tax=Chryseobacterium sp. Mn2064 TaxID=3395263 RepID=UPI003BD90EA3